jgi:threonine dehydratase
MAAAMTQIPTIADVLEARERLNGRAIVTPLIESPALNALAKGRVLIKAECLQRTGSFKFRGA